MRTRAVACCAAATSLLAACATLKGGGGRECRPTTGNLPAGTSTAALAGSFALTLTATAGARAGRTVLGTLSLVPQDSTLQAVEGATQSLRGTATIALDSVGAVQMGDLAAAAPAAPGVAVYEQRAATGVPTVVIRLGSASTARGPQPFDAGNTTLFVKAIAPGGFAGGWSSSFGSVFPPREASGYFCAVRSGP